MSLIKNKKAGFDYEISEKFEAGIELLGLEVKSLRKGQGSLEGSHIIARGGEAFLIGAQIPPFQPSNTAKDYDPKRNRRLLLTKKEIDHISKSESQSGLTIVPISVYNKGNKIKIEIGIARGKKKFDKRETIKKRETDREIRRDWKNK
jgi:SsrA-binding protein